jgi:hypothetical protein
MVARFGLLASMLSVCLLGCTPRYVRNWGRLQVGMSQEDVHLLLGTPDAQVGPIKSAATRPADALPALLFWSEAYGQEVWVYGPPGFFSGLQSLFGPSPDGYVVYYDEQRKVTHWREPLSPTAQASERENHVHEIIAAMARMMIAHDPSAKLVDPSDPALESLHATTQPICSPPRNMRISRRRWRRDGLVGRADRFACCRSASAVLGRGATRRRRVGI